MKDFGIFIYVALMFTCFGFGIACLIFAPATNHDDQVRKQYQCVHIDKGRYIDVDGKKKCVISIDLAPSN